MNKKDIGSFSPSDISPVELDPGQAERFAADIKMLLGYKSRFVSVPCPACGSGVSRKAFEKYGLNYVVCSECETMYVNPRPGQKILDAYYLQSENYCYWNKYIFPATENVRRNKIFRPRVERLIDICKRYGVRRDILVEIGSGFGTFCEEVKRTGFFGRVIGVEPTPDLARTCRQKGIEVLEKPVEQVFFDDNTVGVIAAFEVIEHLFCPRDFLKKCYSMLAHDGALILTCPNVKGFDIAVLQAVSDAVDVEHLNYFHPDSLSGLLAECGFEVVEISTPGRLDAERVRNAVLKNEFDLAPHRFLKQILIDKWDNVGMDFQRFLADNKLSSHMWIAARKR